MMNDASRINMNDISNAQDLAMELLAVERHYEQGDEKLTILNGVNFKLNRGETVALIAPSGAGKSTLLHMAGLLERPDGGEVIIDGVACSDLSDEQRTDVRGKKIGFVYQFHHLLPEFSASENVVIPQLISGLDKKEAESRAKELLEYLKLGHRISHRPTELSGGEQQRVAIARALAPSPKLLIADEPTGNLDGDTGQQIADLLFQKQKERDMTLVLVTHDPSLADRCERKIGVRSGEIEAYSEAAE